MDSLLQDFPKTLTDFERRFPTEEACREFLFRVRWPEGFRCPSCEGSKAWTNTRDMLVCAKCGKHASLTSGTVFHRTRKPLREWFRAMWWVCTQKTGGSAKGLQRLLGLGSYETAWTWLHKLRTAMIRADRERLAGRVEVDDAFIGGEESKVSGRLSFKKAAIVLAVELPEAVPAHREKQPLGRVRIMHVPDFSAASLLPFICENVEPGSEIITDDWSGYARLGMAGYRHRPLCANPLPHAHLVISLLKRWLLGTHHGAVRAKQLQFYLEEYTFRFNRRKSTHVGKLFLRMAQGTVTAKPLPYATIVARPDRPEYVPYNL